MGRESRIDPASIARLDAALARGGLRLGTWDHRTQPFHVLDVRTRGPLPLRLYLWNLRRPRPGEPRVGLDVAPSAARRRHTGPVAVVGQVEHYPPGHYVVWWLADRERWSPADLSIDATVVDRVAALSPRGPDEPIAVVDGRRLATVLRRIALSHPETPDEETIRGALDGLATDTRASADAAGRPVEPDVVRQLSFDELGGFNRAGSAARGSRPVPRRPVVETGFAAANRPTTSLSATEPLPRDADVLFWFAVGSGRAGAIDGSPEPPPGSAPGLPLTVQLFGFHDELQPIGPSQGRIELDAGRCSRVVAAARPDTGAEDADRVLYFSVRTPPRDGSARMRCHVYSGGTLVQSHLVTAVVGAAEGEGPALRSVVDYRLADELRADELDRLPEHDVSILVNGDERSHQLRVFSELDGEALFAGDAALDANGLAEAIRHARSALSRAAWGGDGEWTDGQAYRYATSQPIDVVARDLIRIALYGSGLYRSIVRELTGSAEGRRKLQTLLATRRRIQIASAASGLYVPAAVFYDHKLDNAPDADKPYRLCVRFREALERGTPLEQLTCLDDGCPERDEPMSVCASGFWGFRHDIGWPLSTSRPLTELITDGPPQVLVGVSTDPLLQRRGEHVDRLDALAACTVVTHRDALAAELRKRVPAVIYLYCHGGLMPPGVPYLEIGAPGDAAITEGFWDTEEIYFADPDRRPLIFVNGCHTTALDPSQIVNLVDGFVHEANAIGAIGTELTVFEPLAAPFGEAVMEAFLDGSTTIGAAVRRARLQLLQQGNPLGLVYVPFVAADTRIVGGAPRADAEEDDVTAAA